MINITVPADDLQMSVKHGEAEITLPNYTEFLEHFEVSQLKEFLEAKGYAVLNDDDFEDLKEAQMYYRETQRRHVS